MWNVRNRLNFFSSFAALAVPIGVAGLLASEYARAAPTIRIGSHVTASVEGAPTYADCLQSVGVPCYGPPQIRTAYGLNALLGAGYTGAGQTIVVIDSFGSPTLAADLEQFDKDFGLPDPPSLKVLSPLGTIPFDPSNSDMVGWAFEATLDVEWAHAIAPGASIVLLTSPVSETEGVQGLPQFLALEKYALDHHLGKIISQSWAATENTLFSPPGRAVIASFSEFYERARDESVTVLGSTGDSGTANVGLDLVTNYPFPTVNFPASSPLVTAVGGTTLYADASGNYQFETVWNDDAIGAGAGAGGISQVFPIPDYQRDALPPATRRVLGAHRGIPDVSYNADDYNSAILVYVSFLGSADAGYYLIGGTSCGSPQWAGIVADLNQYGGAALGFLNPRLYALGGRGLFPDFGHDVTIGNNAYDGITGYDATVGWDPATGWGTPKLDLLPLRWSEFSAAR